MSSASGAGGPPPGQALPAVVGEVPGAESRAWLERFARVAAPMGPPAAWAAPGAGGTIVYREGVGANVFDVDGNRYVDLAAGFGALLLGHRPEPVAAAIREQGERLLQALGDVHPSDAKILLLERLSRLTGGGRGILGQSGADALGAALKTAVLRTGRSGVVAFGGAYHGLSHGPLAACGLRASYREPFAAQLNPAVRFVKYPARPAELAPALGAVQRELERGDVGAVLFEPILGRGGVLVPPAGFGSELSALCREHGSLLIADEVWTGLGRSGQWLLAVSEGARPDLVCLGKGLGGGLPISACCGDAELMRSWSREQEVVHTSTFAGAPLAAAAALATLHELERQGLVARSRTLGASLAAALRDVLRRSGLAGWEVRGAGLMLGVDLGAGPISAAELQRELLVRGFIVSLGGGRRDCLVLTPPLDVAEAQLEAFTAAFAACLRGRA